MKKRILTLALALVTMLGLTACGLEQTTEGRLNDTMKTYFFDFTIHSASLASEYNGYTPQEGNTLLVAEITIKNTFRESIEMYDTDFQAQWGDDAEDAYSIPITTDPETYTELPTVGANQLPGTYTLAVDEERFGELVYEVPSGHQDFSISYLEIFDNGTEEGDVGDPYFVFFTAENQI